MQKILICSNYYPPFFVGGAEIIAHEQAKSLSQAGWQVSVFCGRHDEVAARHSLETEDYEGITVFRLVLHSEDYALSGNFAKRAVDDQFETVLEQVQPDVVHFHNLTGLSLGIIDNAKRHGCATVLTLHDHWGFCYKNTRLKHEDQVCQDFSACGECLPNLTDPQGQPSSVRLRKDYIFLQLLKVDRLVSPSPYLARTYQTAGIPSAQLRVISNGIDVDRFAPLQQDKAQQTSIRSPLTFTFIGYLGFHKGVSVLIAALDLLYQSGDLGHTCTIQIVGVGELYDTLATWIETHQLSASVRLLGRIQPSDIEQVYARTDVLINASVWPENQPVTILEAMAAGIPILASDLGGNLDLVEPNVTGILFKSGQARSLFEAMRALIQNPEVILPLGQAAHAKIALDTLDSYRTQISALYQELTDQTSQIPPPENTAIPLTAIPLIVCQGQSVSLPCVHVLNEWRSDTAYRFIMAPVAAELATRVVLLWSVDGTIASTQLYEALSQGWPLLVPENNEALVTICRSGQCGLFYANADEATACLHYLVRHPQVLAALSQNARAFAPLYAKQMKIKIS